jgi:hypothetical protein
MKYGFMILKHSTNKTTADKDMIGQLRAKTKQTAQHPKLMHTETTTLKIK